MCQNVRIHVAKFFALTQNTYCVQICIEVKEFLPQKFAKQQF